MKSLPGTAKVPLCIEPPSWGSFLSLNTSMFGYRHGMYKVEQCHTGWKVTFLLDKTRVPVEYNKTFDNEHAAVDYFSRVAPLWKKESSMWFDRLISNINRLPRIP